MITELDEAIKHCKEVAEKLRDDAESRFYDGDSCLACADEHEQLAEWLTELQERREAMEYIKKYYVLVEKSPRDNPNELIIRKAFGESEAKE